MAASRTTIKVCGVCRPEDAREAVRAGADAIGVVLAPSRRQVTLDEAEAVMARVPGGVMRVAVFVDADPAFVAEAVRRLRLDRVQFHGSESPEQCEAAAAPVVKVLRVAPGFDPSAAEAYRGSVAALLLDTFVTGQDGGSGRAFDWEAVVPLPQGAPVMVAGGLTAETVAEAIRILHPAGVDVSSGVEARLGEKDPEKLRAFCEAVRAADEEENAR